MSIAALATVGVHVALYGAAREADEGTAIRRVDEMPNGMKNGAMAPQLSGPDPMAMGTPWPIPTIV